MTEAGKLDSRVTVYSLTLANDVYSWVSSGVKWAHVEQSAKNTYLSCIGVGARAAEMVFRVGSAPTMYSALEWQGRMYYPTAIIGDDRSGFVSITAAQVEPITATLVTYGTGVVLKTFPAVLLERYIRYMQDRPMAVSQESYVLVVPKAIVFANADIIDLPGFGKFHVDVIHQLDPLRNEYEISREADR